MPELDSKINTINSPLVTRLRSQMLRKGLNPKTLAERANVGRSFVYDILSGRSCNPTSSKIAAIAAELGVSMQYLLTGVNQSADSQLQAWDGIAEIAHLQVEPTVSQNIVVSIFSTKQDHYFSHEGLKQNFGLSAEDLRLYKICCDSMAPTLLFGDVILVDIRKKQTSQTGVFLLFDGTELKPRRLEAISSERILVSADNGKHSNYEAKPSETNIVGKIIWVGRGL